MAITVAFGTVREGQSLNNRRRAYIESPYRLHFNWRHETEDQKRWFVINVLSNRVVDALDTEAEAREKYKGIR